MAQDGGVPHIGCAQDFCERFRKDPRGRPLVASLGLIDHVSGARFLIDATPDVAAQIEALRQGAPAGDRRRPVEGILLTHAHMGHYTGLLQLGREALGAARVPVYATRRMAAFLRSNAPWSQLVTLDQIELREIVPGDEFVLSANLRARAFAVPHRDEFSDTVGYEIRGPAKGLLYIPDVDKWQKWTRDFATAVRGVDHALVDATFESAAEIPGRSIEDIPHPLVDETLSLLPADLRPRVVLIHLNHTNALLWDETRRARVGATGARVAHAFMRLPL